MKDLELVAEWMPEGQREAFLRWALGVERRLAELAFVSPPPAQPKLVPLGAAK